MSLYLIEFTNDFRTRKILVYIQKYAKTATTESNDLIGSNSEIGAEETQQWDGDLRELLQLREVADHLRKRQRVHKFLLISIWSNINVDNERIQSCH